MSGIKKLILVLGIIALNIACDQVSKNYVRKNVESHTTTQLIEDKFILTNVENKGAFLGLGSKLPPFLRVTLLLILPLLVLIAVFSYVLYKKDLDILNQMGMSFIVGGGIGNLYDRFLYGQVTDFFHIDLGGIFRTGIFNMADVSVMVGMGILLAASYFLKKKENLQRKVIDN